MQNICVLKIIEYALYLIYSFIYSEKLLIRFNNNCIYESCHQLLIDALHFNCPLKCYYFYLNFFI